MVTDVLAPAHEPSELDRLRALTDSLTAQVAALHEQLGGQPELEERLRQAVRAAAGPAALMEALDSSAPVGMAYLDLDFRFLHVNQALARMHQATPEEHIGHTVADVIPALWSEIEPLCRSVIRTGEPVVNHEIAGDAGDGRRGHWLSSICAVRISDEIVGLGCLVVDLSEVLRAEELRTAITETMVEGLYALDADGRLTFMNAAASEMLGWREDELRERNVHETIHLQHSDGTPIDEADCLLMRVRIEGRSLNGVEDTFTRRDGTMFAVTYSAAPLAHAEHGQGVVVVFRDATQERAEQLRAQRELDALHWLGRTREAIDEHRLVLYSQPIVPLAGDQPSEELLLRMIGRNGEVIVPARFLPVSEQYGLIAEIDRWVIAQAAVVAAQGRHVKVNLSAKSMDIRLLSYIDNELRGAAARPENVVFELTETVLMGNIANGEKFARGLAKIGCGLALDDFGTGFSSLAYLTALPVQYLKIAAEFVRDLPTQNTNQHLVKAIVALARGLDQKTVAEGVEDEETLVLLREFGVDFAQGYHLGMPAPLADPAAAVLP
jgi:PAS domain S-box-containing protein